MVYPLLKEGLGQLAKDMNRLCHIGVNNRGHRDSRIEINSRDMK